MILFLSQSLFAGIFPGAGQRANKAFEKGKPFAAKRLAYKAINKDSLDPLGYMALSRCLIYVPIPREIDSAHWAEIKATHYFNDLDEKDSLRVLKRSGKKFNWVGLRRRIDSLAFQIALQLNHVESYEHFVQLYPNAPQFSLAASLRDSLAYEIAISEGTSAALEDFLNRYPSSKQAKEAKSIRELFLFREMTLDGTWQSFRNFYHQHPQSPFAFEAHKKVFQLKTFNDELNQYLNFLDSFPENRLKGFADTLVQFQSQHNPRFEPQGEKALWERLLNANQRFDTTLVIAIPDEDGKRQALFSNDSNLVLEKGFDSLVGVQLFNRVRQPWILTKRNNLSSLGHSFYGNFISSKERIEFLSQNWILVQNQGELQVMHLSGKSLFPRPFEKIHNAFPSLFFGKRGKSWNAFAPNGHQYNSKPFDSVYSQGNLILGLRDSLWHGFNISEVRRSGEFKEPQLFRNLDWTNGYLTTRSKNKKLLIDTYSGFAIEKSEGDEITPCPQGWLIRNEDRFTLMNEKGKPLTATPFKEIQQLNYSFAWRPSSKWIVSNQDSTIGIYDSVAPFGNMFNRFWTGDTLFIHNESCLHRIGEKKDIRIHLELGNKGKIFLSRREGIEVSLMDFCGKIIYEGKAEEVIPRTEHLFRIKKSSKYGLVDTSGSIIIRPLYDFISQESNGFLTLFRNKKYRLFNIESGVQEKKDYSSKPQISEYGHAYEQNKNDLIWHDLSKESKGKIPNARLLFQLNDSLIAIKFLNGNSHDHDSCGIYNLFSESFNYSKNGNLFREFKSGNLLTELFGRYGIWNFESNKEILPTVYDEILEYRFRNQVFFLSFLIDEESEMVSIELWDSNGKRKNQSKVKQGLWSDELF